MKRNLLVRSIECKLYTAISDNLQSVILARQYQSHKPFIVSNQEIRIVFAGSINNDKEHEIYIITCTDRDSEYQSAEIVENANASIVIKFFELLKISLSPLFFKS